MRRRGLGLEPLPRRNAENSAAGRPAIGLTQGSLNYRRNKNDYITYRFRRDGWMFWIG